jgi:lambda repressor-like predicted transcriptional regulator
VELLGKCSNQQKVFEKLSRLRDLPSRRGGPKVVVPAQRAKRLTTSERTEMVAEYQAGCSSNALAREYQVSRNAVTAVLEREGVPRRYNLLKAEDVKRASTLYLQGRSLASIAPEFGVDYKTVRTALLRAGIEMRPVGTNQWA